jgi:hypothetical protein
MPTGTGLDAQIGYVAESTYGTGVTVTRFLPLVSETLKTEIEAVESASTFAGFQTLSSNQWALGNKTISGDIQHELYDQSFGLILRAAFGTVNTTTAGGTGTHVFFPANPGVSLTCQIGRPTIYGSVIPFTYEGVKISSFELGAQAGQIMTWGMSVVGEDENMGTALATASYTTNLKPWYARTPTISLLGVTTPVKGFTLAGDNSLAVDRRFLGSTLISEPLRQEYANYTGNLDLEWGYPAARGTLNYAAFLGGTEGTLTMTATSGTLAATITANIRMDGSTPNVAGRGILEHPVPYKVIRAGSLEQHALTISITNNDTTA